MSLSIREPLKVKSLRSEFQKVYILTMRDGQLRHRSDLTGYVVGEMNPSKSGEFRVTSFLSLWHMRSRVL